MFFKYIRDVEVEGSPITRIEFYKTSAYETKLADGSPKWVEATFREWWDTSVADDTKSALTTSAPEGSFYSEIEDPQDTTKTIMLVCSLETGEPEDTSALTGEYVPDTAQDAPEAPSEPSAPAEGTDAPSAPVDAPAEAPAADAPSEEATA